MGVVEVVPMFVAIIMQLDFLEQETVSGSGISWAICKSASRPSHVTMPPLIFYRPDAIPATHPTMSQH